VLTPMFVLMLIVPAHTCTCLENQVASRSLGRAPVSILSSKDIRHVSDDIVRVSMCVEERQQQQRDGERRKQRSWIKFCYL